MESSPLPGLFRACAMSLALSLFFPASAAAGIAYGSINNFDAVNDTGHECHGFEIELDDIHSTDITYTYDYNHYGVSKIVEDNSVPGHPKVFIRWESARNPDGSWSAYTAIPSGPIAPTDGHMFTDPISASLQWSGNSLAHKWQQWMWTPLLA